jgi:hypothetical protein
LDDLYEGPDADPKPDLDPKPWVSSPDPTKRSELLRIRTVPTLLLH